MLNQGAVRQFVHATGQLHCSVYQCLSFGGVKNPHTLLMWILMILWAVVMPNNNHFPDYQAL